MVWVVQQCLSPDRKGQESSSYLVHEPGCLISPNLVPKCLGITRHLLLALQSSLHWNSQNILEGIFWCCRVPVIKVNPGRTLKGLDPWADPKNKSISRNKDECWVAPGYLIYVHMDSLCPEENPESMVDYKLCNSYLSHTWPCGKMAKRGLKELLFLSCFVFILAHSFLRSQSFIVMKMWFWKGSCLHCTDTSVKQLVTSWQLIRKQIRDLQHLLPVTYFHQPVSIS